MPNNINILHKSTVLSPIGSVHASLIARTKHCLTEETDMTRNLRRISRWPMMLTALALVWSGWTLNAADPAGPAKTSSAAAKAKATKRISYPLTTCVVSGDKLGGDMGDPVKYDYQGREIRFCCEGCIAKFKADPAKYLKILDAAVIKQQAPSYPLTLCVVTGQKLDKMGQPINYVYKNRLVRFCCKGCIKKFEKTPEKYLAMIDKARTEGDKAVPAAATDKQQHY
jgi:YHS domain-containing protein